jgi:nucleotide-binding universal stress UspA family protein
LKPYAIDKIETLSRDGEVVEQILTAADQQRSGLIVIGAHGHGRIHEALLGSTTDRMMEQTNKPLLLIR